MDYLYFDGRCPVCRREMAMLTRWKDNDLALIDIHALPGNGEELPPRDTLLRILHLRTAEGEWLTGVEASVRAWRHTALGGLWSVLRWPLIRTVVERVYQRWAARRFEKLYGSCVAEDR